MVATQKTNLLDLDRNGLRELFSQWGEKPYRADQVMKWIYHHLEPNFDAMTDLGRSLRAKLNECACVLPPTTIFEKASVDGTHKWLLGMHAGNAIETVFIPEPTRGTLCISTQVGCAMACAFCSTGAQGFNRNLSAAEMTGQVWVAAKYLSTLPHQDRRITNVVLMGMGEPLANFDNVVRAMSVMRDDLGFGLANKRVTVSTVGLASRIRKLADVADVSLAVSLHAANDALRTSIMPVNKRFPLAELLDACRYYLAARPRATITFEYTLMRGVNDQPEHARELVALMRTIPSKVNLIPFNPFHGTRFERPSDAAIRAFQKVLNDAGIVAPIRRTRGDDIDAACGQLKGRVLDRTRRHPPLPMVQSETGHVAA